MPINQEGITQQDQPNDEAPAQVKHVERIGGDMVIGDKVGGDKVMGDKNIIFQPAPTPPAHPRLRAPAADFVGRSHELD